MKSPASGLEAVESREQGTFQNIPEKAPEDASAPEVRDNPRPICYPMEPIILGSRSPVDQEQIKAFREQSKGGLRDDRSLTWGFSAFMGIQSLLYKCLGCRRTRHISQKCLRLDELCGKGLANEERNRVQFTCLVPRGAGYPLDQFIFLSCWNRSLKKFLLLYS